MTYSILVTAAKNLWQHPWTSASGALLAALLHFTGAQNWQTAALQIAVFVILAIARDPGALGRQRGRQVLAKTSSFER